MIIDGKTIADAILMRVADKVRTLPKPPLLAAVLVKGDVATDLGSKKFLQLKQRAAERVGIDFRLYELEASLGKKGLRRKITEIGHQDATSGIIVQLPLPAGIEPQYILNAIPEAKDPDVLSQKSQGAFFADRSIVLPASVSALKVVIEEYHIDLKAKSCVVFGYGFLIGRPISHWLASRGATVTIINEDTVNPRHFSQQADIVITGVGKPNIVKGDMIKSGAIVIDFGYNQYEGFVCGDVDFAEVSQRALLITPVPGGMGPLVIATLLDNLVTLAIAGRKS